MILRIGWNFFSIMKHKKMILFLLFYLLLLIFILIFIRISQERMISTAWITIRPVQSVRRKREKIEVCGLSLEVMILTWFFLCIPIGKLLEQFGFMYAKVHINVFTWWSNPQTVALAGIRRSSSIVH